MSQDEDKGKNQAAVIRALGLMLRGAHIFPSPSREDALALQSITHQVTALAQAHGILLYDLHVYQRAKQQLATTFIEVNQHIERALHIGLRRAPFPWGKQVKALVRWHALTVRTTADGLHAAIKEAEKLMAALDLEENTDEHERQARQSAK